MENEKKKSIGTFMHRFLKETENKVLLEKNKKRDSPIRLQTFKLATMMHGK